MLHAGGTAIVGILLGAVIAVLVMMFAHLGFNDAGSGSGSGSDSGPDLKAQVHSLRKVLAKYQALAYKAFAVHKLDRPSAMRLCGTTQSEGCLRCAGGTNCYGCSGSTTYLDRLMRGEDVPAPYTCGGSTASLALQDEGPNIPADK